MRTQGRSIDQYAATYLIGSLHSYTNGVEVGKNSLLVSFTQALWRRNLVGPGTGTCVIWILLCKEREEAGEEQVVWYSLVLVVCENAGTSLEITLNLFLGFGLRLIGWSLVVIKIKLSNLLCKVVFALWRLWL